MRISDWSSDVCSSDLWVSAIRVRSGNATEMVADMIVGFKGLRETFTSRVQKTRPSEIHVDYLEGPLKSLTNHWKFAPEPMVALSISASISRFAIACSR